MMSASNNNVSRAMTGANRPQRFKLSLSFLNKKKKRKILLEGDGHSPSRPDDESIHLPEAGLGDVLQDIAEENEEQLQENVSNIACGNVVYNAGDDDGHAEENDEDNLTLALVSKSLSPLVELHNDSSLVQAALSYKSFDITYPPGGSPPSRRRTERSSSMKAVDASTRSGSFRTESTSTQLSTAGHVSVRKGWLGTRCGFRSCSKQIDMESELRAKERAARGERHRSHHSRSKSRDPATWERDTVSDWSVLAGIENDGVRKKLAMRKKKAHKKSSKLAPSPGLSPSDTARGAISESKSSLRDPYEEVREAAKYDLPSQRSDQHKASAELNGSGGHALDTLTDVDGHTCEEQVHPWERSFSSPSSDDELFMTSFEVDAQSKTRRKKWSSNSSDETDGRHRRVTAAGSHTRSKSTWSNHSLRGDVVREDEIVENPKATGKKGSRIIFLSTPPRPMELGMDDDESTTTEQLILKTSSDRFGEYSKLDQGEQPARSLSMGYKASLTPVSFEADMEANAKAWSKLDVRSMKGEDSCSDVSVRELTMISRSKEAGQKLSRHIDVQIEDQLVNLRLESDASDSSRGKAYPSSRGSRKLISKALVKTLDQDKLHIKKKRGTNRRRRGRRAKSHPPPLPADLHGKVKESVAVVKSSYDPYTDFRDSMVEMIVEKEIQGATDLEELLRCYLSLNSAEYHSVIVKVFADVWRELFADAI